MDQPAAISFEQILNATLHMLATTCQTTMALFFVIDDSGRLVLRAADGIRTAGGPAAALPLSDQTVKQCLESDRIVDFSRQAAGGAWASILGTHGAEALFRMVPVFGQARPLGVLVVGPFDPKASSQPHDHELRSAGALCAVLSAHWRLYDWMSKFLPEVNHELRTPLTAVQGSLGMVLGGVFGEVGSEVRAMLEMAQKGCERTVRAIEAYINKQNTDGKLP